MGFDTRAAFRPMLRSIGDNEGRHPARSGRRAHVLEQGAESRDGGGHYGDGRLGEAPKNEWNAFIYSTESEAVVAVMARDVHVKSLPPNVPI